MEGYGRFTYANKDVYEGNFKDGKANGQGNLKSSSGDVYDGNWVDD